MSLEGPVSEPELLAAVAALLRKLPIGRDLPRAAKWRTTEQLANELGLAGRDGFDRLDRVLREHEACCLERLANNLPSQAVIRRAKYPDRTTALPLWGSTEHHGEPWPGHRPDRTDPPDDIPPALVVPDGASHVFLSHTRRDADRSLRLAEALAALGIGCWRFETNIDQRADIADCVRAAIAEATCMMALVTRYSIASLWVLTELHTCLKAGGSVVLVVDASDALLMELLQSVRFPNPDKDFDLSVEYDPKVVDRLKCDYALVESKSRVERYVPQVHDFLASLPSYLGTLQPGTTKRLWRAALAFPQLPARWSGTIELGHLEDVKAQMKTDQNANSRSTSRIRSST
jgi:hypothetical protein